MKRVNVSDMIYNTIKDDFINDNIDFGEKFVETDYAEKLEVSRTPLREAIKKLEHEGLIIRLQNGRLKFLDITENDIIEIFNVRIALENMLLEQSINNNAILKKLEENIIATENAYYNNQLDIARSKIKELTNILYSNLEFEYVIKMLSRNNLLLQKLKKRTLDPDSRINIAMNEHRSIYNALKNNNLQLACELNKNHLIGARNLILENLIKLDIQ